MLAMYWTDTTSNLNVEASDGGLWVRVMSYRWEEAGRYGSLTITRTDAALKHGLVMQLCPCISGTHTCARLLIVKPSDPVFRIDHSLISLCNTFCGTMQANRP
jgi:hypothetical protein